MLKNYLLVAFRNFLRQRLFSFVNVLGLSAGLVCTLLIYLWIQDEVSKDTFHRDSDRIYHVVTNIFNSDGAITWPITPGPLADEIHTTIPEAEFVAQLADDGPRLLQYREESFMPNGYFTNPDFFNIFNYKILEGNAANPLSDPTAIVLTKSLAEKIFGKEEAIGKALRMRGQYDLKVTAILEDVPVQSSLHFEFIAHIDVHKKYREQDWGNFDYPLFIKFKEGVDAHGVTIKINDHVAKILNLDEEGRKQGTYYLQPFADRYLYSEFENGLPVGGRIKYVQIFSTVAIFILVVACINFMNMATARATMRHKEIGVRKSIGAQQRSLHMQFLTESFLVALASMIIALLAVELLLPFFNLLVSKKIDIHYDQWQTVLPLAGIVIITGLLAGSYPSVVLAKVNPVRALKGNSVSGTQGATLRRALVVFQFAISVILIVSSLVIYKQIQFIQSKNLGFNKEQVVLIPARGVKNYETVKEKMRQSPGVASVSMANESLVNVQNQNDSFHWPGKPEKSNLYVRTVVVDYDFIETMGLTVVEGRSFQREFNDTANVIINKKLASMMNVDNAIGLKTEEWGRKGKLVGIVDDFHIRSLSESIDPVVLLCYPPFLNKFYVRVEAGDMKETLRRLEVVYKEASPLYPFEYTFLDDEYDKLYNDEKVMSTLSLGFTCMAVLISGLGLLGLASYATERRKKEISIRKTLGASVQQLIVLISREFVVLTGIALAVGCPIAYLLMEQFLQSYAYHATMHYTIFIGTAAGLLLITLSIVLVQVTKASLTNPVTNLRSNE